VTDSRVKSSHNLIERFRGSKAKSLNLDSFYHLEVPSWLAAMGQQSMASIL
jgi:hypothetical protein